jgi:hypothetical protein
MDLSRPRAVAVAAQAAHIVLRAVRTELEQLDRRRAEAASIARQHWHGGHRDRFEVLFADLEHQARRAHAAVEVLERFADRVADELLTELRGAARAEAATSAHAAGPSAAAAASHTDACAP